MTDDDWKQLAEDAIALLNEWDKNLWAENHQQGQRVMDPDLSDLYRREGALEPTGLPYR